MELPNNINSSLAFLAKLPQKKLSNATSVVLLVVIAYLLAELTWQMLTPKNHFNVQPQAGVIKTSSDMKTGFNLSELKALNLFGQYIAKKDQPKPKVTQTVEDAPETKLNLTLSAVVASLDEAIASAVISNLNQQTTYGIGEKIDGTRATLEQVFADRVIIKHAGKFETLMLDGIKFSKTVAQPESQERIVSAQAQETFDNRNNRELQQQAQEIKSAVLEDPGTLTDYLRISPKKNEEGDIVGYLLMPGKNPEFFKSSGLKSGDVAVQMNGYDLTSPLEAAQALNALKTESEVSLLVDRNGDLNEILFGIQN